MGKEGNDDDGGDDNDGDDDDDGGGGGGDDDDRSQPSRPSWVFRSGSLLEASWGYPGTFFGIFWKSLGPLGVPVVPLGALLGLSWGAVRGHAGLSVDTAASHGGAFAARLRTSQSSR